MDNITFKANFDKNYRFTQMPKFILTDKPYCEMSIGAKLLYLLMFDRVLLSEHNGWKDECDNIFIILTREEAAKLLGVSKNTITKLFNELKNLNLLKEKKQGLNKPHILYLMSPKNCDYGRLKTETQESQNLGTSNTDYNNTEYSNTENLSFCQTDGQADELLLKKIKQNCELEIFDDATADMLETAIDRIFYSKWLKISGVTLYRGKLRTSLLNLDAEALIKVVDNLKNADTKVKRPLIYLMSALVNAAADNTAGNLLLS